MPAQHKLFNHAPSSPQLELADFRQFTLKWETPYLILGTGILLFISFGNRCDFILTEFRVPLCLALKRHSKAWFMRGFLARWKMI